MKNTGELAPRWWAERVVVVINCGEGTADPIEPELGNASGGR